MAVGKVFNRAWMSTATAGTGTITLGSALSGYQTFADAGVANSDVVSYTIVDGASWEIGTGTYTSAGTTMTRSVSESSNADAAVSLSGSATVFITARAEDILSYSKDLTLTATERAQGQKNLNQTTLARSSNTILGVADRGQAVIASSTFTQTLTAAATLGAGWWCDYRNNSTGVITIDPNSSETLNGATTWKIYPGESVKIVCDGSNFVTVGQMTGRVLLNTKTASASASLDFTVFDSTRFQSYEFDVEDLLHATNATSLYALVSTDGGSTWLSTGYYDGRFAALSDSSNGGAGQSNQAQFLVNSVVAGAGTDTANGRINLFPKAARCAITWDTADVTSAGLVRHTNGGGLVLSAANVNGFQLKASSGNLTSGVVRHYGVPK